MAEKRYGKFRGRCMDVHDPEIVGRIRVYCPSVFGDLWSDWASPSFAPGTFALPKEGALVWVEFEEGDTDFPIWTGVWYDREALPPKQGLSEPHSGRTGLVDKDVSEHAPHPIDAVEREPFRQGQSYDATKRVIYQDEQGMEIYTDQWTDEKGGLFFRDRAGNELHIKDDLSDTFRYSDMAGNSVTIQDGLLKLASGLGAFVAIEGNSIRFKADKMHFDVPADGIGLKLGDGALGVGPGGVDGGGGVPVTGGEGGTWPPAYRLTSAPGPREDPINGGSGTHNGWDWAAPSGTPIPSQTPGIVVFAGYHPSFGNYVRIRHGSNDYIYAHNSNNAVSVGQSVSVGQILGYVGSTGDSTGPHVHYEVRNNGLPDTTGEPPTPDEAQEPQEPEEGGPPAEETPGAGGQAEIVSTAPVPYTENTRTFVPLPFEWRGQPALSDKSVKGDGGGVEAGTPGTPAEPGEPGEPGTGVPPTGSYADYAATAYDPALGGINSDGDPSTTASGTSPTAGRTIAVDPSVIPYGSIVYIRVPGMPSRNGYYLAEDTGGAIKGNRVDILIPGYGPAMRFGRRDVEITLVERGTGRADARQKAKNWQAYLRKYGTGGN